MLAAQAARHLATDARVLARLRAISQAEASRLCGAAVTLYATEPRVRVQGTIVHLDLDLEAALP